MALDGLAPRQRLLAQVCLRYAFVDEADLDGLFRGEAPSAEDHLPRQPFADDARQILRRSHGRAGADAGAGLAEHGIVRGNDQVAPQGELVAAAHAPAVDHGNDGDRQAADGHGKTLHAVIPHGAVDPGEALHGVYVAASGKGLVAGAGHDRTGDGRVLARRFQRVDELIEGLLAKGVEDARPVDGRPRDVIGDLVENIGVVPLVRAALLGCGLLCHVLSPIPCFHHRRRAPNLLAELEVDVLDELLVQLELFADEGGKFTRSAARGLDSLHAQPGDDVGLFAASATVALNLVTMPLGVVAGAIRPNQPIALYFGSPASAMVGTWGREGDRASPLTASALTDPASMNGIIPAIGPK